MKIQISTNQQRQSGPWGFLTRTIVLTLATIIAIKLLPGVRIEGGSVWVAIMTALVISLLDNFLRPILIFITLPFTVLTMGLFIFIINAIIDAGMVPYIYTEGKYNTRLECLKEVPKGKVIYHFEEVDMAEAKRVLGDTATISGGFPVYLLDYGTKEQVIDECKRLIDVCAPGGGFIFETSCGMDLAKRENVEAMVETVRTYGKR